MVFLLQQFTPSGVSYTNSILIAVVSIILEAIWVHWSVKRITSPDITSRLVAATPPILLNLWLPLLFSPITAATTVTLLCFNFMWLSNSKLVQWIINRGPLSDISNNITNVSSPSPCSLHAFLQSAAILAIPITPILHPGLRRVSSKGRLYEEAGNFQTLLLFWFVKLAVVGTVVVSILFLDLPPFIRSCFYSFGLYGLLSAVMDGPAALVTALLGLKCSPHFDHPWMATSVASFWSKRWDLAAGNTLRQLIYDPIIEQSLIGGGGGGGGGGGKDSSKEHMPLPPTKKTTKTPPKLSVQRQLLGTFASFIISGLVHECIFYYLQQGHFTGGSWFLFFFVQPLAMISERVLLLGLLKNRWGVHVPDVVRIVLSIGFLLVSGHYLFWRVVEESGVSGRVVRGIMQSWQEVVGVGGGG